MTLYDRLPESIEVDGEAFEIYPSFDRVLEALDSFAVDASDEARADYLCELLIKGSPKDKTKALNAYFAVMLDGKPSDGPRAFDFGQDSKYIYAAFVQAYGIDLYDQRDKLHWWKFIALFNALPSDTLMAEIMRIRTQPIPAATKYNGEEIRSLIKAKAAYRLEISEAEREAEFQQNLNNVARQMRAR